MQNTLTKPKKKTIIDRAPEMSTRQLNIEVDKRINGIMSGHVKGEKLEQLKNEATQLATMILRRGGVRV